jgi:hypothetical protein
MLDSVTLSRACVWVADAFGWLPHVDRKVIEQYLRWTRDIESRAKLYEAAEAVLTTRGEIESLRIESVVNGRTFVTYLRMGPQFHHPRSNVGRLWKALWPSYSRYSWIGPLGLLDQLSKPWTREDNPFRGDPRLFLWMLFDGPYAKLLIAILGCMVSLLVSASTIWSITLVPALLVVLLEILLSFLRRDIRFDRDNVVSGTQRHRDRD